MRAVQVRLGKHARRFHWVQLASAQMLAMAVLSDLWLGADALALAASGAPLDGLWPGYGCEQGLVQAQCLRTKRLRRALT